MSFFEMLQDPHSRHAMLVHFPIVLVFVGVVLLMILGARKFRPKGLKVGVAGCFLAASLGAAAAASAGEDAEDRVEGSAAMTPAAKAVFEEHEELGENGWIWPLIPAGLVLVSLVPRRGLEIGAGALALAGALGVAVWVGKTAHAGGELVYVHGVGVPGPGATAGEVQAPNPARDDDD
ncbi:hypothetical protein PHYC_03647 [Phycisphaerales bacterium]|nr:hypothetical protein PHYC_03647 [Phycisphaerales bacterium]